MESKLEFVLTNSYKRDMIAYMKAHPEAFDELISLALSQKKQFSWRAAWLLWSCMDENDKRVRKVLDKIVTLVPQVADNRQRAFFIILHKMVLDDDMQAQLFDQCVGVWKDVGKQHSVRYHAFMLLAKITECHPSLVNEVEYLADPEYVDNLSAAVRNTVFKTIASLKSIEEANTN